MGRLVPLIACATVLVGAACAGGDDLGPTATVPTAVSSPSPSSVAATTVVPAGADPFAIPEVIDAAYVNRVLAALYQVDGDVTREVLADRAVLPEVIRKIGDIYSDPQLTRELQTLPSLLDGDPARFKDPPGDRRVVVTSVVTARADCIVALVQSDFSEVVYAPTPKDPTTVGLVALVPAAQRVLTRDVNPTPWAIVNAERIALAKPREEFSSCA